MAAPQSGLTRCAGGVPHVPGPSRQPAAVHARLHALLRPVAPAMHCPTAVYVGRHPSREGLGYAIVNFSAPSSATAAMHALDDRAVPRLAGALLAATGAGPPCLPALGRVFQQCRQGLGMAGTRPRHRGAFMGLGVEGLPPVLRSPRMQLRLPVELLANPLRPHPACKCRLRPAGAALCSAP